MFGPITSDAKMLAVCSSVLYVKFLATSMIQGRKGFHAGTRCPEDSKILCANGVPKQSLVGGVEPVPKHLKAAYEDELRWKRIVQNDLESIPMAFVVFMASMSAGGDQQINSMLMVVYTVARIAHTVTYAKQLQPHRMIAWMSGIFCILGAGLNGVLSSA